MHRMSFIPSAGAPDDAAVQTTGGRRRMSFLPGFSASAGATVAGRGGDGNGVALAARVLSSRMTFMPGRRKASVMEPSGIEPSDAPSAELSEPPQAPPRPNASPSASPRRRASIFPPMLGSGNLTISPRSDGQQPPDAGRPIGEGHSSTSRCAVDSLEKSDCSQSSSTLQWPNASPHESPRWRAAIFPPMPGSGISLHCRGLREGYSSMWGCAAAPPEKSDSSGSF